jgi:uncharacterized membrane protein YebE (DUF533 family)
VVASRIAELPLETGDTLLVITALNNLHALEVTRDFILTEMTKPMETENIVAKAKGNPQLAAELYAASLLAIKVDTPAEQEYMRNLAGHLGLAPQVVANLESTMGLH